MSNENCSICGHYAQISFHQTLPDNTIRIVCHQCYLDEKYKITRPSKITTERRFIQCEIEFAERRRVSV